MPNHQRLIPVTGPLQGKRAEKQDVVRKALAGALRNPLIEAESSSPLPHSIINARERKHVVDLVQALAGGRFGSLAEARAVVLESYPPERFPPGDGRALESGYRRMLELCAADGPDAKES